MLDREYFYKHSPYTLQPFQKQGFEAMFNRWDKLGLKDLRYLAYILATSWHETGTTMQPIEEIGKGKHKPYGLKIKYSGKRYITPDKIYYGRGHTQNTWYEIYEMLSDEAKREGYSWDFLNNPDLLLQMEPSIWATFYCMINGKYTGRRLSHYFNTTTDWLNARKIINGLDKHIKIADYAKKFHSILRDKTG